MKIYTEFLASYELEAVSFLPDKEDFLHYFPPIDSLPRPQYETSLKFIYRNSPAWWGLFGARSKQERGLTMASTMPDADTCCVSTFGTGYTVDVARPQNWRLVELYPVLNVFVIKNKNLILLHDFTRIMAYDENGLRWRSPSLCSDDLRVSRSEGNAVECSGWDASMDHTTTFIVDLASGKPR